MTPNGRTSQTERMTTSSSTATTEVAPSSSVLLARRLDELAEALHGLADADGADDLAGAGRRGVVDRRGDVHHRGARIAFDVGRRACAVAAAQSEEDVVPARVVGADLRQRAGAPVAAEPAAATLSAAPGSGARIEDHGSLAVDDRHAQLDARLLDAVDVGDWKRRA